MSIEDFFFTGSISNSIRDGGNSDWKSRLLLFSVVQTNGAETERAVHLPQRRGASPHYPRGRVFHSRRYFINRYAYLA